MTRAARHLLWVAAAAPVMAGVELGGRIFANNDDARFAVLAQDVLSSGLRFFPELNGAPYYNKPALLAWLIALASWPAGHVTQLTAALPSAAAGVATAVAVWALGRDMFGPEAGTYAALVAVATQGVFLQARLPLPDMLMTCFITAALWQFWRMIQDGARVATFVAGSARPTCAVGGLRKARVATFVAGSLRPARTVGGLRKARVAHWLGFYALTAAAFWAKGPAGFLPLAVAVGWAAATPHAGAWRRLRLGPGLPVLAALVAPWWLLAFTADSAAIRDTVVVDHLMWYLPQTLTWKSVTAPFRNSFGILFPWVLVLPIVAAQAVRRARARSAEGERVRVLLVWALVTLVVVGISRQQRLRYYLPLVPPVALLIAWWLAATVPRRREAARMPWRTYAVGATAVGAVTAGTLVAGGGLPRDASISLPASFFEVLVLAGGLVTMLGALVYGVRGKRVGRAFAVAWLGSAVFVVGAYHWEVGRFNAAHDFPRVSQRMAPALRDASVLATWGVPELPLSFYFKRRVVVVETNAELDHVMSGALSTVAIMTEGVLASNRERLTVLANDRLALRSVSLVRRE